MVEIQDSRHQEVGKIIDGPECEHGCGSSNMRTRILILVEHVNSLGLATPNQTMKQNQRKENQNHEVKNPNPRISQQIHPRFKRREWLGDEVGWPADGNLILPVESIVIRI